MKIVTSPAKWCLLQAVLTTVALGFLAYSATAQQAVPSAHPTSQMDAPAPKVTNPLSPKPIKIGSLTLSGSLRVRVEDWDWFETSAADGSYTFGASLLRLALGQQKDKFDWQVEGAFPLLVNLPTRAIAPAPQGQLGLGASYFAASGKQDGSAILRQAFVRFKGLGGDKPSSLRR